MGRDRPGVLLRVADADSYYGRDGFVRGLSLWLSGFEDPHFEPREVEEVGGRVVMRVLVSGRATSQGGTRAQKAAAGRKGGTKSR